MGKVLKAQLSVEALIAIAALVSFIAVLASVEYALNQKAKAATNELEKEIALLKAYLIATSAALNDRTAIASVEGCSALGNLSCRFGEELRTRELVYRWDGNEPI